MLRSVLLFLFLSASILAYGGVAEYTDRGKIDFDGVMQLLNPYGTWSKADGLWAYTPLDHQAPYTNGRWIYTEYGWYWKGNLPHSWATEHYGYWKRGENHLWSWYPGPYWLPEIVELRATSTHIGWRSAAVDSDGSFIEAPSDRYAKTDEWTFVTRKQFTQPITPDLLAKPDVVASQLDDSSECTHTYVTYREIERPGPHPADLIALSGDDGMFPPHAYAPEVPAPPATATPPPTPPSAATSQPHAAGAPAASQTVPKPQLLSNTEGADAPVDRRQVAYWITMSLPTRWTTQPPEAKPNEVYIFRPDIYQDQDGIERRIGLWIDPASRSSLGVRLRDVLGVSPSAKPPAAPAGPGTPAVPATSASDRGPFRSPFDDSFHGGGAAPAKTSGPGAASTKAAPSGLGTPAPAGTATNSQPAP